MGDSVSIGPNGVAANTGQAFHTVQSADDAARLAGGGAPWPTSAHARSSVRVFTHVNDQSKAVTRTFVPHDIATYDVTLSTGEKLTTTQEHPFWVTTRDWTPATDLHPDGTTIIVASVHPTGHTATVYNFEVQGLHTYHVQAGTHWILVHNTCGDAAANAVDDVATASNTIYSTRALQRMADKPGPFHNFPGSFDETVFSQGNRTVVPNYFNKTKPNLGNDSTQYRRPGHLNGRASTYEIFTRPSLSGRTELIMHRFFRPDY